MRSTIASRMVWRLLALLALTGTIQLVALPGKAWAGFAEEFTDGYDGDGEGGPGTRWRECRDDAWADYNDCLMDDPDSSGNRAVCYVLWDLDAAYCDWTLIADMISPWKVIFR